MEMEKLNLMMVVILKDNLKMILLMVLENGYGLMVKHMKVNGLIIKWVGKV